MPRCTRPGAGRSDRAGPVILSINLNLTGEVVVDAMGSQGSQRHLVDFGDSFTVFDHGIAVLVRIDRP